MSLKWENGKSIIVLNYYNFILPSCMADCKQRKCFMVADALPTPLCSALSQIMYSLTPYHVDDIFTAYQQQTGDITPQARH